VLVSSAVQGYVGERENMWKFEENLAERINTELFIDGIHELHIHKRQTKISWLDLLERGRETGSDARTLGNENK